jgi:hypothetical protein
MLGPRRPPLAEVDITSPAFKADPYPFYARLREEAPVCAVTLPNRMTAWLVTRYDDVALVLRDERFAKDVAKVLTPEEAARLPRPAGLFKPLTSAAAPAGPGRLPRKGIPWPRPPATSAARARRPWHAGGASQPRGRVR